MYSLSIEILQAYWWILISILGAFLVVLFFVQGGQMLLNVLAKDKAQKDLIINSLGRKWELTFTTLVVFGGAAFAAFPLFYSTSFGGAYFVWMIILFSFIIQAVSYEYRSKVDNFLGTKTYETFLQINGYVGVFLLGIVISTFFTGASFSLNDYNFVSWDNDFRGLEALIDFRNYLLALALVFLARTLGNGYLMNNINNDEIITRAKKSMLKNGLLFLIFFVGFLLFILLKDGFVISGTTIIMHPYTYLLNFMHMPFFAVLLLLGIVLVLYGLFLGCFTTSVRGIWPLGFGVFLAVFSILASLGLGNTAFYPSNNLKYALSIANASSSHYTLATMAYVSFGIPFILAYIIYVWSKMDFVKLNKKELEKEDDKY